MFGRVLTNQLVHCKVIDILLFVDKNSFQSRTLIVGHDLTDGNPLRVFLLRGNGQHPDGVAESRDVNSLAKEKERKNKNNLKNNPN